MHYYSAEIKKQPFERRSFCAGVVQSFWHGAGLIGQVGGFYAPGAEGFPCELPRKDFFSQFGEIQRFSGSEPDILSAQVQVVQ